MRIEQAIEIIIERYKDTPKCKTMVSKLRTDLMRCRLERGVNAGTVNLLNNIKFSG